MSLNKLIDVHATLDDILSYLLPSVIFGSTVSSASPALALHDSSDDGGDHADAGCSDAKHLHHAHSLGLRLLALPRGLATVNGGHPTRDRDVLNREAVAHATAGRSDEHVGELLDNVIELGLEDDGVVGDGDA